MSLAPCRKPSLNGRNRMGLVSFRDSLARQRLPYIQGHIERWFFIWSRAICMMSNELQDKLFAEQEAERAAIR